MRARDSQARLACFIHERTRHEYDRPERRHRATFWGRKMIGWRRFDESGARRALGARYAVLQGHGQ
jgi:hypothetical protein